MRDAPRRLFDEVLDIAGCEPDKSMHRRFRHERRVASLLTATAAAVAFFIRLRSILSAKRSNEADSSRDVLSSDEHAGNFLSSLDLGPYKGQWEVGMYNREPTVRLAKAHSDSVLADDVAS